MANGKAAVLKRDQISFSFRVRRRCLPSVGAGLSQTVRGAGGETGRWPREQNVCVHGPGAVVGCGPPHSAEVQACVSTEAQLCRDLG